MKFLGSLIITVGVIILIILAVVCVVWEILAALVIGFIFILFKLVFISVCKIDKEEE